MSRIEKSKERVRKHGEVFTPIHIVKKMVDCLEEEQAGRVESIYDPGSTFMEPTCGNGVFVGEICRRKFNRFHALKRDPVNALKDVYAVDIMPDNVQQARCQALGQYVMFCIDNNIRPKLKQALEIVKKNVVCGNFLKPETIFLFDWKDQKEFCLKDCEKDEYG